MNNSDFKDTKTFNALVLIIGIAAIIFSIWLFLKCQPHYMEIGDGSGLVEIVK